MTEVEDQQARQLDLLMDRGIGDAAKAAVSRKLADTEARRLELLATLDGLRERATDTTDALTSMVRAVFEEAGPTSPQR